MVIVECWEQDSRGEIRNCANSAPFRMTKIGEVNLEKGCRTQGLALRYSSAVAEIFGIFVGVAEIVVDQDRGLAGKLEALAAFVAGDQIVQANHERSGFREFAAVFFAGAAGKFPFLAETFQRTGASNSPRQLGQINLTLRVSSFSV